MTASQSQPASTTAFRQKKRQEELAEVNKMIAYFSVKQSQYDELNAVHERLQPQYLRKRPALLIWGIASAFFGIVFLLAGIIPLGVAALLGAGALIFAFVWTAVVRNRNYAAAQQRLYALSEELERYHAAYGPCFLSTTYSDPHTLAAIRDVIQSGRADTITDALNILLHGQS